MWIGLQVHSGAGEELNLCSSSIFCCKKSEKSWHCPFCPLESFAPPTNSTFSLLAPPSLHFLHEFSASSSQLSFQDLSPGNGLSVPWLFPGSRAKPLLSALPCILSAAPGHCWRGGWHCSTHKQLPLRHRALGWALLESHLLERQGLWNLRASWDEISLSAAVAASAALCWLLHSP